MSATAKRNLGGKYLAFTLAGEQYGLEIQKVREIIGIMAITAVPRMPSYIKGVINLRGRVIPVQALRTKFNLPEQDGGCIVVVRLGETEMGLIVDGVCEVRNIPAEQIDDVPSFGAQVDTRFILGIGKNDQRITILLDIEQILGVQERAKDAA